MNCTPPAASVSFSSRNASVELPSVNSARTSMNCLNARGSGDRDVDRVRRVRLTSDGGPADSRTTPDATRSSSSLHEEDQRDGDRAGNDRQREQRAVVVRIEEQKQRSRARADDGADVIHGAMEAVHLAARASASPTWRASRRAARCGRPCRRDRGRGPRTPAVHDCVIAIERPAARRQRVASQDERPLRARPIGQPARQDLQNAVDRFGRAFDDAERDGPARRTCVRKNGSSG